MFLSDTGTNGPADPHRFQNQSDYADNYNFRTGELNIPSKGLYFFRYGYQGVLKVQNYKAVSRLSLQGLLNLKFIVMS